VKKKKKGFEEEPIPLDRAAAIYNVTVKCLRVLASWTTSVSELVVININCLIETVVLIDI